MVLEFHCSVANSYKKLCCCQWIFQQNCKDLCCVFNSNVRYLVDFGNVCLTMEAPYDGSEVTVVMEEIEGTYTYTSPVPSKKKKKYRSPGDQGEKAKKPR